MNKFKAHFSGQEVKDKKDPRNRLTTRLNINIFAIQAKFQYIT